MNRLMQWVMAAALICSSTVFTSCSNDDNSVDPAKNLSEKIIGKWMTADRYGQPAPTNKKKVFNIVSTTKAYMSASLISLPEVGSYWIDVIENDVDISGNKVTLTNHPDEHRTVVEEYTVTAINDKEFTANRKMTITSDGVEVVSEEGVIRYVKLTADYAEPILGLWECKGLKGDETFNDGDDRLEFFEDGTYNYYRKNDAGEWEAVTTREFQDYFVDGTLLATRWKNIDEDELREWWEIAYLKGDKMQWKALRANEDGSTFEQIMDWEKIEED